MKNIEKKINIKSVVLITITALLALFAFITNYIAVGIALVVAIIVLFFIGLTREVYSATGSSIKRRVFYFESDKVYDVERAIRSKFRESRPEVEFLSYGNGRLDVALSKDRKFGEVTISRYTPHKYEQMGEAILFKEEELVELYHYLKIK